MSIPLFMDKAALLTGPNKYGFRRISLSRPLSLDLMAVSVFVLGLGGVQRQIDNKDITPSKQIPFQIPLFLSFISSLFLVFVFVFRFVGA